VFLILDNLRNYLLTKAPKFKKIKEALITITKLIMKSSIQTKKNIWLVLFITICFIAVFEDKSESANKKIYLDSSERQLEKISITTGTEVELSNDSKTTFYNFTVIQIHSGKRMVSIENIKPSASFNLAFGSAGTYIACYSKDSEKLLDKSTCLQIDVFGFRSI